MIGAMLLAGAFPIRAMADLTNIGILAAFVVFCAAVILFRYTRPDTPRTYRLPLMPLMPLVPLAPAIGVLSSAFLISQLTLDTYACFVIWLVTGLIVYFGYGRKHSLLNPASPLHHRPPVHQPTTD